MPASRSARRNTCEKESSGHEARYHFFLPRRQVAKPDADLAKPKASSKPAEVDSQNATAYPAGGTSKSVLMASPSALPTGAPQFGQNFTVAPTLPPQEEQLTESVVRLTRP